MKFEVKAPTVGESITEVSILKWAKIDGESVKNGDLLLEIESDKATVEIVAENAGVLSILKPAGERINVGTVIGSIDSEGKATFTGAPTSVSVGVSTSSAPPSAPSVNTSTHLSPSVQRVVTENQLNPASIAGTGKGGRITKGDALSQIGNKSPNRSIFPEPKNTDIPGTRRVKMSLLRSKIAERLVHAQHTAAILTTFNEVDMKPVMELRTKHKDSFKAKHGVSLGFMSFFARASVEALKTIPEVNAYVDGDEILYHDTCDIGVAVGTDRGLVVPVVRGTEKMGFSDIEKRIAELATKARDGKLSIADMSGGTFTISNGGVYGSLLSTPILNPPQSAILGMHKIMDRPIVVDGKIEIRPMMYLALSYDHRIIDGKGAVTFLVTVKDFLEHPEKLNFEY